LNKAERAAALGVSERHVTRIEAGEVAVNTDRLVAIAQATDVPLAFLTDGFTPEDPTVPERVEALEHQYATLRAEIAEARTTVAEALADQGALLAQHTREIEALQAANRQPGQAEGSGQ
jgi:transcriptional regulator with XRE-family HTH domain